MTFKLPKLFWLIIPALVFIILIAAFISQLPPQQSVSVESEGKLPTTNSATVPTPLPKTATELLIEKIEAYQVEDPTLVAPNFDSEISLPEE